MKDEQRRKQGGWMVQEGRRHEGRGKKKKEKRQGKRKQVGLQALEGRLSQDGWRVLEAVQLAALEVPHSLGNLFSQLIRREVAPVDPNNRGA